MQNVTTSSIALSVLLLMLCTTFVPGDIIVTQVNVVNLTSWIIDGIATYEDGGAVFEFQCTSTSNNGNGLSWSRQDAVSITKSQNIITGGISLDFSNPTASDAAVYICSDSNSNDDNAVVNITTDNPAANSKETSITSFNGDTVTIIMYASALTSLSESNIAWTLNNENVENGNYQNNNKELIISDVQTSDAGTYKMTVTIPSNSAAAYTTLNVLVFLDPVLSSFGGVAGIVNGIVEVVEGSDLTLSCGDPGNTVEPRYQWFDDSGNSLTGISNSPPLVLVLNDILRDKSGEYVCRNTLSDNPEVRMTSVTVNVIYPPKVLSITPENTTLIEGSTLTFNCSYDANPAPNVTWGQNMSSIDTSDSNFNIVTEETYSLLEVTFANINYSGVYGCSIDNGIPPSDVSNGVNIIVQVAPDPVFDLTAPSNDITSDSIKLAWTLGFDGNANITGVNITYIATSNFASPHSGFEMVSGQRTEAIIEDLQPLTTYEFTVVVLNSVSDEVGSSSEESVSTMTAPLVPNIPTITSLIPVRSTGLNVTWIATIDPHTQTDINMFRIEYYIDGEDPTEPVIMINDPDIRSITISELKDNTTYGVRIQAINSGGPSEYSTPVTQTTLLSPLGPPSVSFSDSPLLSPSLSSTFFSFSSTSLLSSSPSPTQSNARRNTILTTSGRVTVIIVVIITLPIVLFCFLVSQINYFSF